MARVKAKAKAKKKSPINHRPDKYDRALLELIDTFGVSLLHKHKVIKLLSLQIIKENLYLIPLDGFDPVKDDFHFIYLRQKQLAQELTDKGIFVVLIFSSLITESNIEDKPEIEEKLRNNDISDIPTQEITSVSIQDKNGGFIYILDQDEIGIRLISKTQELPVIVNSQEQSENLN